MTTTDHASHEPPPFHSISRRKSAVCRHRISALAEEPLSFRISPRCRPIPLCGRRATTTI